jgi:hypothetical protein
VNTRPILDRVVARLACSDGPAEADLIFALAGRRDRKVYALHLFAGGLAPRLLLSVGRFEIRRFTELDLPVKLDLLNLASQIVPAQRHFFVSFEGGRVQAERIPVGRFGTLREIEALAQWLQERPSIERVLVISSSAHLRRVQMCCRALLPGGRIVRLVASDEEFRSSAERR